MATGWTAELDKKEHKNWVMVGCALNITKNGITPLIQRQMEAWYQSLISSPPLHSLPPCTCAGHSSKCATCTTWKKELERLHKSPRPKICWNNSDRQQWGSPAGVWEIAKVFMPTLGTRKGDIIDANTTDISGLLNVLEWCPFIHSSVNRVVLNAVRDKGRNHWAHSPKQELQDADVNTIFGHLNNLLSDPVFKADKAVQESSKNLQDLFYHGLVNVRESEVEALHLLGQSLVADVTRCMNDLSEVKTRSSGNKEEIAELRDQLAELDTEVHAARTDLGKGQNDLLEAQENIRQLTSDIKRSEECAQRDLSNLKEQGAFHREEFAKHGKQLTDTLTDVEVLKQEISMLLKSVENFNRLLDERDDLHGALDVISEDLKNVAGCLDDVVPDLNTAKDKIADLEVSIESMKSEVETFKAKSSVVQREDDVATPCTAPRQLQEFTGRETALLWLEHNLVSNKDSSKFSGISCCTKTICGLGGCGKTSLAVEFAWRWKKHFTGGVFWINGESDENVRKSVAENLALLNIPASTNENVDDSLNRFLALLSNKNCPWLLVVDNADELTSPKCPSGVMKICNGPWQRNAKAPKNGQILFTTRQNERDIKTLLKLSPKDCLELQSFTEKEGALFLMQRTGLEEESLYKEAVDLAKELGGLPLALEQAAAYISALPIPCTFKPYLDKYREVRLRLLKHQPVTALSIEAQHRLSVHTTWEMNFEFVAEKSPAAATMMRIASFLESENIPFEVINPGLPAIDQVELREAACSKIDISAILKVLTCYSLFSVDQQSKVFSVHKLVQEVVRDSLTSRIRTETLTAAMRVLHCALRKKSESCLRFDGHYVINWLEVDKEDKNILIALLLNSRKLKDHLQAEMKLSMDRFVDCIGSDDTFGQLFNLTKRLIGMNIFLVKLNAEFSEFMLQVQRMCCREDPRTILVMMVEASVRRRNCSDLVSYEEAKKLADEAVRKLYELETSGAILPDDVKYLVLEQRASYYAIEGEWKKNYEALLQLESLKLSAAESVDLQMMIARAENQVSACNFKSALKRHKYALKLARELQPPDQGMLLRVLQHIATLLNNEGKSTEAKPYAEEMLDVCKTMPHDSDYYIKGMTDALVILSTFDSQKSETMLLKMLEKRWPRIYTSVINGCTETRVVIIEDGSDDHAAGVLEGLLVCWSKACERNVQNATKKIHLTIAQIALAIRKKFYGETNPRLKTAYMNLKEINSILGNEADAKHYMQLLQQCDTEPKQQFFQRVPQCDVNMYATRALKDRGNALFREHDYVGAYKHYSDALGSSPNDAKLLTNRAATSLKLSEKQCSLKVKQEWLRRALDDSQNAIKTDPSWAKGYYWKAVCLAHLDERGPSLATAAISRHLFPSNCTNIPVVERRFGKFDVHVVNTVQDFQSAAEKTDTRNLVIVVKEGRYQLTEPLKVPENTVMVGLGKVQIMCYSCVPQAIYMENIAQSSTDESIKSLKESAKACLDRGQLDAALTMYNEALVLCPNDSKILTSRASTYLRSAQQQNGSPSKRKPSLQLALNDAEAAIKADPSWLLGYRVKSVTLAELGRKPEALAAAAVFKHLSQGRDISEVTQRYGEIQVLHVETSDQLRRVIQNAEKLEGNSKNQVVVIKEGEYLLETSVEISEEIVIVGHGKVSVVCKTGEPLRFTTACHVENVEMAKDCDSQEKSQEFSSNDIQPEVIRLATPSGYDNTSNECKVN